MARITGLTGPIRIGDNTGMAWAGRLDFDATASPSTNTPGANFTHIFRASANMMLTPRNASAAKIVSTATAGLFVTMSDNSTITITHATDAGETAQFAFLVFDGGTSINF